jgi:glutamyl endopeptidase
VPDSNASTGGQSGFGGDGKTRNGGPVGGQKPSGPGDIGVLTTFPPDERVRVDPTTVFPASAVVWLTRTVNGQTTKWCTGWMYAPNKVATAGHCVHQGKGGGWIPSNEITAWPGRNGNSAPYGSCGVRASHTVLGWSDKSLAASDYGALTLDCNIGYSAGWFGWWWQTASLDHVPATVAGYPSASGDQYKHDSIIGRSDDDQLFYRHDTSSGQGGAPIYQFRADGSRYCVGWCTMGINAFEADPLFPYNVGVRITKQVGKMLNFWRDEFPA